MKKLEEYINKYNQIKAELTDVVNSELKAEFSAFFKENPEITALGWTQYAPHFNDGEPCTFSVGSLYFSRDSNVNYDSPFEDDDEDEDGNLVDCRWESTYSWTNDAYNQHIPSCVKELVKLKDSVPDSIMQDVFGDDVKVFITKEEIRIEDYSEQHE